MAANVQLDALRAELAEAKAANDVSAKQTIASMCVCFSCAVMKNRFDCGILPDI